MSQSFTYSARAVRSLLQAATNCDEVPPRLLRATQAAAFGVFRHLGSGWRALVADVGRQVLRQFIQRDYWGHVTPDEADAFVDMMCRAGILVILPSPATGTVDVQLSEKALLRRRPPSLDAEALALADEGALLGSLFELLDGRGAYAVISKREISETSGMSRSAVKRGIARLERDGVVIREVGANELRLAWSPSVLENSWRGVQRFDVKFGADGRSISIDSRLRVRLPGGGVTFLPPGCRIEIPEQTVDEFFIDLSARGGPAPLAPVGSGEPLHEDSSPEDSP